MVISAFRQTNRARGAEHGRKQKMQKGKLLLASIAAMLVATPAFAQTAVKIGVLNDRSGIYADRAGEGSVIAARMAVEDFDAKTKGIDVTFVSADHQNKPAFGSNIVRLWVATEGVKVHVSVPTPPVGPAVTQFLRAQKRLYLGSRAATTP